METAAPASETILVFRCSRHPSRSLRDLRPGSLDMKRPERDWEALYRDMRSRAEDRLERLEAEEKKAEELRRQIRRLESYPET